MLPPRLPLSRRSTLAGLAGGVIGVGLPAAAHAGARGQVALRVAAAPFLHGVASGDPDATSVVLWTRISTDQRDKVTVDWELAADEGFARLIASGQVETGPEQDFTVKIMATGLPAGTQFWYRFHALGATSMPGRTRTLPSGRLDRLGIALATCSNYAFGFFNAYDAIARDPSVDFVLHTGDYIYEYGAQEWGGDVAARIGRGHQPAHEIVSLADYRQRHAQYKTDPGAQAMHAAHPLLACWDDHESANNPWVGGAQNHQPETEGSWQDRRAASVRAYFEWMPMREPEATAHPQRSRMQFWRQYRFGDLATLVTLETRHTARARQIDYGDYEQVIATQADADKMVRDVIGAPGRTMLAAELEADLDAALRRSVGEGQTWRLIGNPMPIARTRVPDVVGQGLLPDPFAVPNSSTAAKALAWKGKWNLPFYTDTWDGYDWARERLYDLARSAGADDLVFLTGDSHSFWANQLADASGRPAGIELGAAGITSPGDFVDSGFGPALSQQLDRAFEAHNPEVLWSDNMHQGYVRLDMARRTAVATFVAVDTVTSPVYRTTTLKRFKLSQTGQQLEISELAGD
ncbi:MAG: hypothetical protein RIQ99_497 [Pseudomonadota bacterium]